MISTVKSKRALALVLAGTTVAVAGAGPASARPYEQLYPASTAGSVDSSSVPPPPSSIAVSARRAYEDLRSPDGTATPPSTGARPVVDVPSSPGWFDVESAAIGAATGGALAIALLAAGGLLRRRPWSDRTARA